MEQNNNLSNQFQSLTSHFEKGKQENSLDNLKERFRDTKKFNELPLTAQMMLDEAGRMTGEQHLYRVLTHICNNIARTFEVDSPIKCNHCGEVVK